MGLVYISSSSSGTHIKRLLTKIVKKTMAHLLRQMYVDEIDFEAVTIEKIVDLVFTEMIHDKMRQLEKEELAKQDQVAKLMAIISQGLKSLLRCSTMKDAG